MAAMVLKNLFFTSSKSQVTPNLVGSIGVTYRAKIVKNVPIGNPRWLPCGQLENQFFASSSDLEGHLTQNLAGSIGMTCRSKIAKIVPIENLFFASSPKLKKPVDSKLAW